MKHCLHILLLLLLFVSCTEKDGLRDSMPHAYKARIVVVLPLSSSEGQSVRLRRTVDWARRNIELAQTDMFNSVNIDVEWHDEDREDMVRLSQELAKRDDVKVIIGPYHSENIRTMCGAVGYVEDLDVTPRKVILCPRLSSDEVLRQFNMSASTAKLRNFVWALSETDITQCEVLLSRAYNDGAKTVGLLASDDMYGDTFYRWFAFQAREMGMRPVFVEHFTIENMEDKVKGAMSCGADYLICAPSDARSAMAMLDARSRDVTSAPKLLFSDATHTDDMLRYSQNEHVEGVSLCADPKSGFIQAYKAQFGEIPNDYEALLYDAMMMAAYSLYDSCCEGDYNLCNALDRLLASENESDTYVWDVMGMRKMFDMISERRYINIAGASGLLHFDRTTFSNVTSSTYCHWSVHDGRFVNMEYVASEGNNRVSSTMGNWNWKTTVLQEFDENLMVHDYPALHERWAVVVCTSSGWFNYRHHADALSVYQLLKRYGYDDSHIVLVIDDDVAYDHRNPYQGEVRNNINGANLHENVVVDYNLKDLKPQDLEHILCGESDERLKEVVNADSDDNVFVYWVGHGLPGVMVWGYDEKTVTENFVRTLQNKISTQGCYRKMMWVVETCFSGSVMTGIRGSDGCMAMCSAADNEQSWGENNDIGTWMTNRFTRVWRETVSRYPDISYHELYTRVAKGTIGSHVTMINEERFDNLYMNSFAEFLR